MADGKYFTIRSKLNGFALDLCDGDCSSGQEVTMCECHGNDNQLWCEDRVSGVIRSKVNDKYVLHMTDDTLTVNKADDNEPMQRWQRSGDHLMLQSNPSLVMDIRGGSEEPGAKLCAYELHGNANQLWTFEHKSPLYLRIKSKLNGRYLDVRGGDANPGAEVIMYDIGEGDNQLWWEDHNGVIRSKLNDFAIDTTDGRACMQPYDESCADQQWMKCGKRIGNVSRPSECLDIECANEDNGASVIVYEYHGNANQRWVFEYV